MFRIISISIVALHLLVCLVFGQKNYLSIEKKILDEILAPNRYDPRIRASNDSYTLQPTIVAINIFFRNIEYVDSKKMEWKVQLTFRQQWNDARLRFDDQRGQIRYLVLNDVNRIWKPDVFFSNSKSGQSHGVMVPNILVRIYPNGNVLFSTRITLTLSCPMDLKHYPFHKPICSLKLASYGYTTDDIVFLWKEGDPIQVTRSLHLPEMTLDSFSTEYCTSRTNTGTYSCLAANFEFSGTDSRFVTKWILPTAIITFVSFVSFWLRRDSYARILTLVMTLLLVYLHTILMNYDMPSVSYSTATDCWTLTCLLFIFAATVEYGIVKCIDRRDKYSNKKTNCNQDCEKSKSNNCEDGDTVAMKPLVKGGCDYHVGEGYSVNNYVQKWRQAPLGCRIDSIAGIVFPLLFIFYIIIFYHKMMKHD